MRWSWYPLDIHWIPTEFPCVHHDISMIFPSAQASLAGATSRCQVRAVDQEDQPGEGSSTRISWWKPFWKETWWNLVNMKQMAPTNWGTRIIPKSHFCHQWFFSSLAQVIYSSVGLKSRVRTRGHLGAKAEHRGISRDGLGVPENLRNWNVYGTRYILGTVHIIASDVSPLHSPVIIWTPCVFA